MLVVSNYRDGKVVKSQDTNDLEFTVKGSNTAYK